MGTYTHMSVKNGIVNVRITEIEGLGEGSVDVDSEVLSCACPRTYTLKPSIQFVANIACAFARVNALEQTKV